MLLTFWEGMAKAVADVDNPDEKQGGFASDDSNITGFSHMHDDGTGGVIPKDKTVRSRSDQVFSHLLLETFPFSLKRDALEIMLPTASFPRPIVPLSGCRAALKPNRDILQLA